MNIENKILLGRINTLRARVALLNTWAHVRANDQLLFAEAKIEAGHLDWARRVIDGVETWSLS